MTSFIPNFNAPSQNYAASSPTPYSKRRHSRDSNRGGGDPRNRRRRVRSSAPAGTRVETLPDGNQVSVTPAMRRLGERQKRKEQKQSLPARTPTKPSDLLLSPEEMRNREIGNTMRQLQGMRDRGNAPSTWVGPFTPQINRNEPEATPAPRAPRAPLQRATVRQSPSDLFDEASRRTQSREAQGARERQSFYGPGGAGVATPDQAFNNTRRQREAGAMSRGGYRPFNRDSPEDFDAATSFKPAPFQMEGRGIGGSPAVNEEAARLGMDPEAKRYLDEQDRRRQMAGLLYSAPMGLYNYLFGD